MSGLDIRIAGESDLDDLVELFRISVEAHARRVGRPVTAGFDWPEEVALRLKQPGRRYFVAWVDGVAVGLQTVHLGGVKPVSVVSRIRRMWRRVPSTNPLEAVRTGFLTDIYVKDEYRRRGVGRALVQAAAVYLDAAGYETSMMDVLVDNEAMLALAESLGFERHTVRLVRKRP